MGTGIAAEVVLGIMAQESQMNSPRWQYRYEPHLARRQWPEELYRYTNVPERLFSSYGAMQLMYCFMVTDHHFNNFPEALYIPEVNVPLGIMHLKQKLRVAKGDLDLALTLYNGSPKDPRAQAYPGKVREKMARLAYASRG